MPHADGERARMPRRSPGRTEAWVQLATRVPAGLRRALKIHCVKADIPVMRFVVEAIQTKLDRERQRRERERPTAASAVGDRRGQTT